MRELCGDTLCGNDQFPTGPNGEMCGDQIARSGAPGRPSRYCENSEHTRAKSFAARRAFERVPVGGLPAQPRVEPVVSERPVTDGRTSLGALLSQFEDTAARAQQAAADQQARLGAILERAIEVIRTVSDPDAAGYEVEQIQRETSVKVAEAQTVQAQAEQEARTAKKKADREAELRAQADQAAEQALREVDAMRAKTAETIARITDETETTIAEHQERTERAAARKELERVRTEAAEAVTAAHADAERHKRRTNRGPGPRARRARGRHVPPDRAVQGGHASRGASKGRGHRAKHDQASGSR